MTCGDHVRKQIRHAVAELLARLPTTEGRVFTSRVYPLQASELPALRVYTDEEDVLVLSALERPYAQQRTVRIVIEGCARATSDLDDTLDQIAKEVEIALGGSLTQAQKGGAQDLVLRTIAVEMTGDGDAPVGVIRMGYDAIYIVTSNAPDVAH